MLELDVSVRPPRNQGEAIQLTVLNGTVAVTVIVVPGAAVAGFGDTLTDTPGTATAAVDCCTAVWTVDVVADVVTACRAPTRDAFTNTCCTISARPNSMNPTIIRKNTGATTANSVADAPNRHERRQRRPGQPACRRPVVASPAPSKGVLCVRHLVQGTNCFNTRNMGMPLHPYSVDLFHQDDR